MKRDYTSLLAGKRWDFVRNKLTEDIKDKALCASTNVVLNNTANAILSANLMSDLVYLPKIILPLVRRVYPNLIAHQLLSVQPMTGPTGFIRFVEVFKEGKNGVKTNLWPWNTAEKGSTIYKTSTAVDGTISENMTINTDRKNAFVNLTNTAVEGSMYVKFSGTIGTKVYVDETIAIVDKNKVVYSTHRDSVDDDIPVVLGGVFDNGVLMITFKTALPSAGDFTSLVVSYDSPAMERNVAEENIGGSAASARTYNSLRFEIQRKPVEARSRKLGASYSLEFMDDYKNEFGKNFEDEVVNYLESTINTEIDAEILDMLFSNSMFNNYNWDASMPGTWTRGVSAWYETLMPVINKAAARIFAHSHIQAQYYLVCSPKVATVIQSMNTYRGTGNPTQNSAMSVGTVNIGTLSNQFKVYSSPLAPDDTILIGFKGNKPEDTGAVYSPYVPISLHPQTFQTVPSLMARTRYALTMIRPEFFASVNITGLDA